jgi:hypothetical protein
MHYKNGIRDRTSWFPATQHPVYAKLTDGSGNVSFQRAKGENLGSFIPVSQPERDTTSSDWSAFESETDEPIPSSLFSWAQHPPTVKEDQMSSKPVDHKDLGRVQGAT